MATAERKSKSKPMPYTLFGPPPAPGEETVERYSRDVRVLHWANAVAWIVLFITGLFFFVPQFGGAAVGGASGLLHRIAAVVMVGWACLFLLKDPGGTFKGIGMALKWGKDDIKWLFAAIPYYFFGKEDNMPAQDHMNTGQKLWWITVLAGGALMAVTGAFMWFFKEMASAQTFLVMSVLHDVGFIVLLCFALLHMYLIIHPKMRGIFWSMWNGSISAKYAASHHKKWYDKISKGGA